MPRKIITRERVSIRATRYFTDGGEPTCARRFGVKVDGSDSQVCEFYRTQKMGVHETCLFASDDDHGLGVRLRRRGVHEHGSLIPGSFCRLFNVKERAKCTNS